MLLLLLSCANSKPPPTYPDDTAPSGLDSGDSAPPDDTKGADTGSWETGGVDTSPDLPPPVLEDCGLTPPSLEVRYAGASPLIPSMPMALIDHLSFNPGPAGDYTGLCVGQFFEGGGELIHCEDRSASVGGVYLQGAPAPGQSVWLALGVEVADGRICWADPLYKLELGLPTRATRLYAPAGVALSTPDYPPAALSVINNDGMTLMQAVALMDAPTFGVRAGDTLWSLDTHNYQHPPIEIQTLANGLFAFSSDANQDPIATSILDPEYLETTAAIDRAGFPWYEYESCDAEAPDAVCIGYLHHGNAGAPEADLYITAGYEALYTAAGEPVTFSEGGIDYELIGTTFKGYTLSAGRGYGALTPAFELSFMDEFDLKVSDALIPGPAIFPSPDTTYRSALYVNSADLRPDDLDPSRFHLTGTLAASSIHGFYDLELDADGTLYDRRLYVPDNTALTWRSAGGVSPVSPQPHSAELLGREADGALHYLVYDRNAQAVLSETPYCAGVFHMVDRDGTVSVSGPYYSLLDTPDDGAVCGNSMAYGDESVLNEVRLSGTDAPVSLMVVSDNVAVSPEQAARGGTIEEIYYNGSPRTTGLFINPDRFDPEGWTLAAGLVGHNGAAPDSNGFTNLIRDWPTIMVSDAPFVLEGF